MSPAGQLGVFAQVACPVHVCHPVQVTVKAPHVGMKPEQVEVPSQVGHPAEVGEQHVGLPGQVELPWQVLNPAHE